MSKQDSLVVPAPAVNSGALLKAIVAAGFLAGTLDLLGAFFTYGVLISKVPPGKILQSIASGIFGKAAFSKETMMQFFGLFFHYCIAMIFAAFYFFIYPLVPLLHRHKIISGLLYGIGVWMVMNLAVVPISNVAHRTFTVKGTLIGMSLIILFIGLPVALVTHCHYQSKKP